MALFRTVVCPNDLCGITDHGGSSKALPGKRRRKMLKHGPPAVPQFPTVAPRAPAAASAVAPRVPTWCAPGWRPVAPAKEQRPPVETLVRADRTPLQRGGGCPAHWVFFRTPNSSQRAGGIPPKNERGEAVGLRLTSPSRETIFFFKIPIWDLMFLQAVCTGRGLICVSPRFGNKICSVWDFKHFAAQNSFSRRFIISIFYPPQRSAPQKSNEFCGRDIGKFP